MLDQGSKLGIRALPVALKGMKKGEKVKLAVQPECEWHLGVRGCALLLVCGPAATVLCWM